MMHKHKKRHALIAGLAVSSLAFSGLGVSAVFAADDVTPVESPAPISSIVASNKVEVTIHKYTPSTKADTDAKNQATGKELNVGTDLPGAKTVEGVTFTAYKVQYDGKDIDLTTNAGWVHATNFKTLFDKDNTASSWTDVLSKKYTLVQVGAKTTSSLGTVTFKEGTDTGFTKTLYIFKETVPANITSVKVGGTPLAATESLTPAAPFLVTLPMTDPAQLNTWMYAVHVYPKNSVTAVTKKPTDQGAAGSGTTTADKSVIPYSITADIPKAENGFKKFYLVDKLPKELTYVGDQTTTKDTVAVGTLVNGKFTPETGVTFTSPTDYTIINVPYAGTDPALAGKRIVTLNFTEAGLTKLAQHQGKKVEWKLHARVDVGNGDEVANSATVIPIPEGQTDGGWDPNTPKEIPPGPTTPEVKTYYGKAVIQKRGTDNQNKALQDATFELFQCNDQGQFVKPDFTVTTNKEEARVTVKNVTSWTTGTDGNATISGLLVNDWRNNSDTMPDGSTKWVNKSFYCLVETKAPTGYEILPKPVMFQVKTTNDAKTVNVKVLDVPKNGNFALPLTGANGIAMMVVIGVLLVGGSGLYVAAVTRRNKKEADKKGIA